MHGSISGGTYRSTNVLRQADRTLAAQRNRAVCRLAAYCNKVTLPVNMGQVLRIDEIWLAREPLDMRCGPETTLARVIKAFGAAKPHCAYIFANKRANRMKILLCDGFGIWLLARRLHQGRFVWSALRSGDPVALDDLQLQALASGLPWQYAAANFVIDRQ